MLKRTTDVLGAVVGLVLLSPVLVLVSLTVRWRLGRPVLFRHLVHLAQKGPRVFLQDAGSLLGRQEAHAEGAALAVVLDITADEDEQRKRLRLADRGGAAGGSDIGR